MSSFVPSLPASSCVVAVREHAQSPRLKDAASQGRDEARASAQLPRPALHDHPSYP